jgi:hypothetical protein
VIATIVTQMNIGGMGGTGTIIATVTIATTTGIEASLFSRPINDLLEGTV